jgi:predicted nucleic acid-binding protein
VRGLIDNDVLLKGACYGVLLEITSAVFPNRNEVGVLGAARFVVSKSIKRQALNRDSADAERTFANFLAHVRILEPDTQESGVAADLELAAQRLGLALDAGESQLCAILINRGLSLILTGDKRAIQAAEQLIDVDTRLLAICGKAMCLEQAFLLTLPGLGPDALRAAVCSEPNVDKALTICFGCHSAATSAENYTEGLRSYVNSLRSTASRVLVA